jgi:RNA polymerase sigma-70 factor (ECF subfamily)
MASAATDEDLVVRLRAGDLAAFDELYLRYERRLFGYLRRSVGDRALAEDLFQDVLLTVLTDRSFDPARGRFGAWVFTVARNKWRMHGRHAAVEAASNEPAVAASTTNLEDATGRNKTVRDAMAGLPDAQQELLVLKQVGELSYREIAELQGIQEGTVKSRLHAAMRAFRERLAHAEEIGESG